MSDLNPGLQEQARWQRRRLTVISGHHYVGTWSVTAGTPVDPGEEPEEKFEMQIAPAGGDEYTLLYRKTDTKPWFYLQTLEYMPDTRTLENRVGADGRPRRIEGELREPERCITFWNCGVRNRSERDKCAIFAMRLGKNHPADGEDLPFCEEGTNGSWGAEEGGG